MSDSTLEEESLVSQDDIDKLLDASSLEEAEESLDTPELEADPEMDDMGELSQDDIDSLLSGPSEDEASDAQDDAGELSQDDIDSLLGGSDDGDDDDMELISQDDIDSLVNGADGEADDDEDELISMDDIQDLIGEGPEQDTEDSPPSIETAGDEETTPAQDDSQAEGAPLSEAPPVSEEETAKDQEAENTKTSNASDPYDDPISETDALAVTDCLVTQETMDELIRNAPDLEAEPDSQAEPDPVPEAETTVDDSAPGPEDGPDDPVDMGADPGIDEGPVDLDASDDDLDNLLEDAGGDVDLGAEADGDVSQEDIDALLQESDDADDFLDGDDDILISQDDIDTLLMAADQEDEDVLGDLLGDGEDMGDEFDEQEVISGSDEASQEAEPVVLEEGAGDEPKAEGGSGDNERVEKIKALLKSKLVLAAASILLVLGISVPGVYFLFFSGTPVALPEKEAVPVADTLTRDLDVASVSIEEDSLMPAVRQSGTIVLADFVILSADQETDMTYIYADISIDYSDQRAYHEISNNLSFYRDLIYEAIQTSLVSEKRNQVTESDLLWGVETSLKKVLPPHFIEKISFKTFRTS
jgi:pilus assembly protein FimV